MSDIIHLLPDSIANQIAAGEVIQRPASVVKELMENAIDAGADKILIIIKNAGRTSIQVTDNGKGMSHTDARMAFERHATSKIKSANDLFALHTMGFRGEALASIAAVASVELKTKTAASEFGTFIEISASNIIKHESISATQGTTFLIKNLFFNVPARRKFLKTDETELRHIIYEFQRVALAKSEIEFELYNNTEAIYVLPISNFKQRIVDIFGKKSKNYSKQLIAVEADTNIVKISGFIGSPQSSAKNAAQFFFTNGRFMRNPYFNKAIMTAFANMLQPETQPNYFINLWVNPENIDVNIHPTKTEIKFEDDKEIWAILLASVKEALGKLNVSIDFNTEGKIDIPIYRPDNHAQMPKVNLNQNYNPFAGGSSNYRSSNTQNWDLLYERKNKYNITQNIDTQQTIVDKNEPFSEFFIYKDKFLMTAVKSGLMVVHKQRAIERIIYEKILLQLQQGQSAVQSVLFPEIISLTADEVLVLKEILPDLTALGFNLEKDSENSYAVKGIPSILTDVPNIIEILQNILSCVGENSIEIEIFEKIAIQISKNYAKYSTQKITKDEMEPLLASLFQCSNPNLSPEGERIISILSDEEIFK